jgi:diaminohydroxyphosphoribosylaminopyrimidine deaminase/5-amino-6-(5-phosphoribosylamino)uracil reductase
MPVDIDEKFMRIALAEAQKGLGFTSPNPAVGAVLVLNGSVIGRGFHAGAGLPHAEVECFRIVQGAIPAEATLYVTLEPCCTFGRTPPCTNAIIDSGVRRVVVGAIDANPNHRGAGLEILRASGIEVRSGILARESEAMNEGFNKWVRTRRPFVIAKCGMSLDGRLTRPPGEERWLTSSKARRHAHELRAKVDAILIGAETLRVDNPRLTVRGVKKAQQPWRVVISRTGKLPRAAHVFTDRFADRTIVYRNRSLSAVLRDLGRKQITSVLIEGGGEVLGQAVDQRLIDKVQLYVAPLITGGPIAAFGGRGAGSTNEALRLTRISYEKIGPDLCVTAYVDNAPTPAAE